MPYNSSIKQKGHYLRNKDSYKLRSIKNRFGLTKEEYYSLFEGQDHRCALCGNPFLSQRDAHVDHCHETNKVRGILCMKCNVGLGMLGDTVSGLEKAIAYLKGELR